jgi:hypothetical protein
MTIYNAEVNEKEVLPRRLRDALGRMKVTQIRNIYDADFEYGKQPLRWEEFTAGGGTITHNSKLGGVNLNLTTANGDITIRQSRPYHRYQPGKTMAMATAVNFGTAQANQVQRVGFLDDSNGVFFEQGNPTTTNPYGMFVVIRSDGKGLPTDRRIPITEWNGDRRIIEGIRWERIQMVWIEYAWYGAGAIRWGIMLKGEPIILHEFGQGNSFDASGVGATQAWSRTGNLPVRYEQRNLGAVATTNSMTHYGVMVAVDGGIDDQRGFTYAYGMALGSPRRTVAAATTRFPVMSLRMRNMGTIEYTQASSAITAGTTTSLTATGTPWTVNQWLGKFVSYVVAGVMYTARVVSNTTGVLTLEDVVTKGPLAVAPVAGQNYTIGIINRGQILPRRMMISASALAQCELYLSTPTSPIVLTGASWTPLTSVGSAFSFAERDVAATAMTGGEKVFKFTLPAGGSGLQDIDLAFLFQLFNNLKGDRSDILTLAITTQAGTPCDVGADILAQEAMS